MVSSVESLMAHPWSNVYTIILMHELISSSSSYSYLSRLHPPLHLPLARLSMTASTPFFHALLNILVIPMLLQQEFAKNIMVESYLVFYLLLIVYYINPNCHGNQDCYNSRVFLATTTQKKKRWNLLREF